MGHAPYPAFTLAMLESDLPGGHSPALLRRAQQPVADDAVRLAQRSGDFCDFPEFMIAHEMAHQWWGQAVGWKNYHEQWISEGFAQYFATLYAREKRGENMYPLDHPGLRRWSMEHSDQGPIRSATGSATSRTSRACSGPSSTTRARRCCTCCAADRRRGVLQRPARLLRQLRYKKAGTDDLRRRWRRRADSGSSASSALDPRLGVAPGAADHGHEGDGDGVTYNRPATCSSAADDHAAVCRRLVGGQDRELLTEASGTIAVPCAVGR